MRLSQSQADLPGAFIGIFVIAAICIWSCGCNVPRQPAGYVPDDVRYAVSCQSIAIQSKEESKTIPIQLWQDAEPSTRDASGIILFDGTGINDQYQYTLKADVTTSVVCQHFCCHACNPPHRNKPGSTCCMCFQEIPLPPPCDHFYVKQAIPIDSPLAGFDLDWMPCKCIHCNDLTICK